MEETIDYAEPTISFTPYEILSRLGSGGECELSKVISEFPSIDRSSLLKQLSLHLPRFDAAQILQSDCVLKEAHRLAKRLETLRAPYLNRIPPATLANIQLEDLRFCRIPDDIAKPLLACFHYILSFRERSTHFGLRVGLNDEWPVIMASLSPFDLKNVAPALTKNGQVAPAIVLSRVFAFPAAPRNAFSFLMSRVRQWIASKYPKVDVLLTYVNPNIGFSGASYKADNWRLIGEERGTRYLYLDSNYKTDRFLYLHFRRPIDILLSSPRFGVSASRHKLEPLKIFVRNIFGSEANIGKHHFERWSPQESTQA